MLEIAETETICPRLLVVQQESFLEKKDEKGYSKLSFIMRMEKCDLDIDYEANI